LTRAHLAETVSPFLTVSRREAADLVDAVLDEIVDTLARGEEVKLSGFGVFSIRSKNERVGRNPRNGEPARITPRKVVVFRASRVLKARIAGGPQPASNDDE
jgi:integration host factor subunit alpha